MKKQRVGRFSTHGISIRLIKERKLKERNQNYE
jgi:hypothetical protein